MTVIHILEVSFRLLRNFECRKRHAHIYTHTHTAKKKETKLKLTK